MSGEDLDPDDWEAFRADAHGALDRMIDRLRDVRRRPVWTETPPEVRERFRSPLPMQGQPLARTLETFEADIAPYALANGHPLFLGWVHGAGTPIGMVAEMLAGGLNSNCGGRDHVALEVERQIAVWMAQAVGFPADASGLFVTGASMANLVALLVARAHAAGAQDVRRAGVAALEAPLVAYASREAHGCVKQAMEIAGLGSAQLRQIGCDAARRMRLEGLREAIATDRAAGMRPFLVVGSAGTVDVGAIDDLDAIATIAREEGLWFHVDGAFGAMAALAPGLRPLLAGLERADSIAFDFHKWLHVPYDAGFVLVRDAAAHRRAFAGPAGYLTRAPRGLAAGETWPCDLGPDLSRGFRALKTWFTLQTLGAERLGASIERTCRMARRLQARIEASERLAMRAPVALNIVCFGVADDLDGEIAREVVMDLQARGEAAPSLTVLDGVPAIRAAIVNHRTGEADIDRFAALVEAAVARARGEADAGL